MVTGGLMLRLVTFNVHAGHHQRARLSALAPLINEMSPDVLVLQELNRLSYVRRFRRDLPSLPHCAFKHFGPLVSGGLVTLSRRPIHDCRYMSYGRRSARPRPSLDQWLMPKGALIASMTVGDDSTLVVINTHLQHNPTGDWSRRHRFTLREQFELHRLADAIADIPSDQPLIVAGDLNVPSGSWLLDGLLEKTALVDALGSRPEHTFRRKVGQTPQAIDHVLVRGGGGTAVTATARLRFKDEQVPLPDGSMVHLSDHYGIEATVTVPTPAT